MKITGPGSGPPDAAGPSEGPKGPGGADGKGFAEKIGAPSGTRMAEGPGPTDAVADIGAELRAGRISPEVAIERVIDRVLQRQVGANAPASVREKVGAALRQALEDDPLLAEKIRTLG